MRRVVGFAHVVCGMIVLVLPMTHARGASIAYDSAGDSAYNTGGTFFQVNGGYGWGGGWAGPLGTNVDFGLELGASAIPSINSPVGDKGRAWSLPGSAGPMPAETDAVRPFNGLLSIGQTFAMDSDLGQVLLTGPSPKPSDFNYYIRPEVSDYFAAVAGGALFDTGVPDRNGVHIELTLVDSSTAELTLTSYGAGNVTASFDLPVLPVAEVRVVNQARDVGVSFNNIAISPEPSMMAIIMCASAMTLLRRR